MQKALAMLAVFLFAVYLGCSSSARLGNRTKLLKSLLNSMKRLSDLMRYERLPLSQLLERCGEESGLFQAVALNVVAGKSPSLAYLEAVQALTKQSPQYGSLTDGDRMALKTFFNGLGSGDLVSERERAQLAMLQMEAAATEAGTEYATRGKLCRTLGVLAGAAAAILIL